MVTGIFNTYSQGENRVTAALLAVLRSLALSRAEQILRNLLQDDAFSLVTFRDQLGGKGSVPDAAIIANAVVLIETKVVRNSLRENQLREHLLRLNSFETGTGCLLVLTPDVAEPLVIQALADDRVAWVSFAQLSDAIDKLLADPYELTSEREKFLLRELQALFEDEGLFAPETDTLVIAARIAWGEYLASHAYFCQPERSFRPVERIAFYSSNRIYELVPRIIKATGAIRFVPEEHDGPIRSAMEKLLHGRPQFRGTTRQLFLLSAPEDSETLRLEAPIENDLRDAEGRRTAFTQGQRYVRSSLLQTAKATSELI